MDEKKQQIKQREAGMMVVTGMQGVGKTYKNMHAIKDYVSDKIKLGIRGRKALIFDTNGEYTREQFQKNGVENFAPKLIALKDIKAWSAVNIPECRRIDAKNVSIEDKSKILELLIRDFRNGLLVIEDINTYIINVTHMVEIVGGLVNLRHRAVDILVSYQSLRAVEPRMWGNARWIRMHYQADNISDIKGKVNNMALFKIAQLLVNNRYFSGDKRFLIYVMQAAQQLEGDFKKEEFMKAAKQYLVMNKKYIKEYMQIHDVSQEQAIEGQCQQYYDQYYGNPDKES